MILVLTGPVHSGKTSFLRQVIARLRKQNVAFDGYLSFAVIREGRNIGYDLFDLTTEEATPFLRCEGEKGWPRVGRYFFVPEGLEKARQKIVACSPRTFLIVDEIGPMEVRGGGVWPAFSSWLKKAGRGCLLVVRRSILGDFLRRVEPSRVEVIDIGDKQASLKIERRLRTSSEGKRRGSKE